MSATPSSATRSGTRRAADLYALKPAEVHPLVARALQDPEAIPPEAPESLKRMMAESLEVPDWFDNEMSRIASRAFLRNSPLVLAALVGGSIVEGFSTLISKSFRIRGRVAEMGVRRLKQKRAATWSSNTCPEASCRSAMAGGCRCGSGWFTHGRDSSS